MTSTSMKAVGIMKLIWSARFNWTSKGNRSGIFECVHEFKMIYMWATKIVRNWIHFFFFTFLFLSFFSIPRLIYLECPIYWLMSLSMLLAANLDGILMKDDGPDWTWSRNSEASSRRIKLILTKRSTKRELLNVKAMLLGLRLSRTTRKTAP